MREINVEEIITNIKEMCIEANHFLSDDMKNILVTSEQNEKSELGKKYFVSFRKILTLTGKK